MKLDALKGFLEQPTPPSVCVCINIDTKEKENEDTPIPEDVSSDSETDSGDSEDIQEEAKGGTKPSDSKLDGEEITKFHKAGYLVSKVPFHCATCDYVDGSYCTKLKLDINSEDGCCNVWMNKEAVQPIE